MDFIRLITAILIGKTTSWFSKFFNLGNGSTWPGHLAVKIYPKILEKYLSQVKKEIIIIAGTNGKTTTSKIIKTVLLKNNQKVVHNESGANLINGIISSFIINSNFTGMINCDYGIFEVDEATLPIFLDEIINYGDKISASNTVILLNLFRDQLDRYGEVDSIARKWISVIKKLPDKSVLLLNADDPQIAEIGFMSDTKKLYFGMSDKIPYLKFSDHARDFQYCLNCSGKLKYHGIYYSHLGNWYCPKCGRKRPNSDIDNIDPVIDGGTYNLYNTQAAVLTCKKLGYEDKDIKSALADFIPAFGRQELFNVNNKKIKVILAKNPVGLNEAIRAINLNNQKNITVILALNDQIPDGKDVSWIWDSEIEELISACDHIICTGDRSLDMAVRVKYAGFDSHKIIIETDYKKAINTGLENTPVNHTLYILPTYTAMLEIRYVITGKKIL